MQQGCKEKLVRSYKAQSDDKNTVTRKFEVLKIVGLGCPSSWHHIPEHTQFHSLSRTPEFSHLKSGLSSYRRQAVGTSQI